MKLNERDLAPFLAVNARDAVAITLTPINEADTSFCGGYPTLPVSLDWPRDPNGNECIFLAQINLAELEILPEGWPASGYLFIFLNAELENTGETATDASFLYYASADQVFGTRTPASPIHAESYFWYEGDGSAGMGRKGNISLDLDALPQTGCRFTRFTDYNYPASYSARKGGAELLLREEIAATRDIAAEPDEIAKRVGALAHDNLMRVSEQPEKPPHNGGLELIDPGFALRATWWGRPERYAETKGPAHPYFADWPHAAKVIFYHAKGISFAEQFGAERDNAVDALSAQIAAEAEGWMRWAKEQGAAPLSEEIRQEYRNWCQRMLTKCFYVAGPKFYDPPRVWQRFYSLRQRLYHLIPKAHRKARADIRSIYAHRIREIENLYDPIEKVRGPAEADAGTVGQLFGYGESIQVEADVHRDKTLVFQCQALPHVSFGDGDFKLWLATKDLKPNAWQSVVAVNATS